MTKKEAPDFKEIAKRVEEVAYKRFKVAKVETHPSEPYEIAKPERRQRIYM